MVFDQVENVKHFVPNSIIVIHVSRQFTDWDSRITANMTNLGDIVVNPVRMATSFGAGVQCDIHLSNYRFIREAEDIDFFCLHSSNDLFISHGMEGYLRDNDAGFFRNKISEAVEWSPSNRRGALSDRVLQIAMANVGITDAYASQVEGSFYRSRVMDQVIRTIHDANERSGPIGGPIDDLLLQLISIGGPRLRRVVNWTRPRSAFYPREEVYFPTIASRFASRVGYPYCYMNWKRQLQLSIEEIDACIDGSISDSPDIQDASKRSFFAVKRVPRRMDDPIRTYVRELMQI